MSRMIVFTQEQTEEIVKMYKQGMGCLEIGPLFGCKEEPINRTLRQAGVRLRNQRLTEDEKAMARSMYAAGQPSTEIAEELGCGSNTLTQILAREGLIRSWTKSWQAT